MLAAVVCLCGLSVAAAAQQTPSGAEGAGLRSVLVVDAEAEGDLGDDQRAAQLALRSAALTRALKSQLEAEGLYRVVASDPSMESVARFRGRRELRACRACLQEMAQALGASRVLSAWVFRMSNLVLTLHAQLLDGETGAVLWWRSLSFRGDNDQSWTRATAYLVRELKDTPAGQR